MNSIILRKQKKAISPVIATLLLILIAIAAAMVLYAYVMGFMGQQSVPQQQQTDSVAINVWYYTADTTYVYVQNTGQLPATVVALYWYYADGTLLAGDTSLSTSLPAQQITELSVTPSPVVALSSNTLYYLKVVTANGAVAQSAIQKG